MDVYKLYNSKDIEHLKQELKNYKQRVETRKMSNTNGECTMMVSEFLNLKGAMRNMNENFQEQIEDLAEENFNLSAQIQMVNESVSQLHQDVSRVLDKMEEIQFNELSEKMDHIINKQAGNSTDVKDEIDMLKRETSSQQEQTTPINVIPKNTNKRNEAKQSEYRQLKRILQSSKNVEQAPNGKRNNSSQRPAQRLGSLSPSTEVRNTLHMDTGKKSFRDTQYELNKNIITRTTSTKQQKKKTYDDPTQTSVNISDNTPSFLSSEEDTTPNDTIREETSIEQKGMKIQSTTNPEQMNEADNSSSSTDEDMLIPSNDEELPTTSNKGEEETDHHYETMNTTNDVPSFFSLFKKKKHEK